MGGKMTAKKNAESNVSTDSIEYAVVSDPRIAIPKAALNPINTTDGGISDFRTFNQCEIINPTNSTPSESDNDA